MEEKCGMCVNAFLSKTVCYECKNHNYKHFERKRIMEKFKVNKINEQKKFYRIFNTLTKKYVKLEDGSFAVFEYPIQCEKFIEKNFNNSKVYKVVEFKKVNKNVKKL